MVGTLLCVGTVLAGTAIGTTVGPRLPARIQQRVLAGLGLITLVIGVDAHSTVSEGLVHRVAAVLRRPARGDRLDPGRAHRRVPDLAPKAMLDGFAL